MFIVYILVQTYNCIMTTIVYCIHLSRYIPHYLACTLIFSIIELFLPNKYRNNVLIVIYLYFVI